MVDLNGARSGQPEHLDIIRSIVENTGLKVEVGGGIRTMKTLKAYADAGVSHMVLGTALIKDPDLVRRATQAYGNKVVAGLDARAGRLLWRAGARRRVFPWPSWPQNLPAWAFATWCTPTSLETVCRRA